MVDAASSHQLCPMCGETADPASECCSNCGERLRAKYLPGVLEATLEKLNKQISLLICLWFLYGTILIPSLLALEPNPEPWPFQIAAFLFSVAIIIGLLTRWPIILIVNAAAQLVSGCVILFLFLSGSGSEISSNTMPIKTVLVMGIPYFSCWVSFSACDNAQKLITAGYNLRGEQQQKRS